MFDDDILLPENWLINYYNYYNNDEKAVIITAASYSKFTSKPPAYIEKMICSNVQQLNKQA